MHKSYNLLEHSKFINNLNEIKNILLFLSQKNLKNLMSQFSEWSQY